MRDELVAMVDRALSTVPREALVGVRQLELELDWLMRRAVALARRDGYEWAPIGRLLGRSRQAVRQRFRSMVPVASPSSRRRDVTERYRAEVHELLADVRRIREADGDDVVPW